ncbi:MAG: HAD family hydrolase, partial [Candidatus Brocadiaceae bacterium]
MPGENVRLRLAALDIDGTVVDSAGQVSGELKAVLALLTERGIHTVLCTGRRWRSAVPVLEELEHAHPVIVCSGGALVKRADDGRTLYSEPMGPVAAERAVGLFRGAGLVPFLLYDRPLDEREVLISASERRCAEKLTYVKANPEAIGWYEGEWPAGTGPPLEVYTVDAAERVQRAAESVRAGMGDEGIVEAMFQQRYGGELALEVRSPYATKWRALERVLRQWDIRPDEV